MEFIQCSWNSIVAVINFVFFVGIRREDIRENTIIISISSGTDPLLPARTLQPEGSAYCPNPSTSLPAGLLHGIPAAQLEALRGFDSPVLAHV